MAAPPLPGAVTFPDGTPVRGRGLRRPVPDGPAPDFGLYLGGRRLRAETPPPPWPHAWVAWPDFWLPADREAAQRAIVDLHARALRGERVETACGGGIGRTGTALACVAILAGVPAPDAVAWVRAHYDRRAVETPWQRRWVRRFGAAHGPSAT